MYRIPSWISTWRLWRKLHPDSWLLKEQRDHGSHYVPSYGPQLESHQDVKNVLSALRQEIRLTRDTLVFGVTSDGENEVFPLNILSREPAVIEFRLKGRRLVMFQDSSEHAAGVYIPELNGRLLTFSTMKNGQDIQFTDDQTHSLWGFDGRAASGTLKGSILTPVVTIRCHYQEWVAAFPKSQIYHQTIPH